MKTLIVVSHPDVAGSNTQQFLKASAEPVPDVTWHQLDDAPLDLEAERQLLLAADRVVFQFPLYWYSAPASLKRWLDQVWVRSVVYDDRGGLLNGKSLGLVVSFSQPEAAYQLGGSEQVSLSTLLAPYAALARKTGMRLLAPLTISQFAYTTESDRFALMSRYQQYLSLAHPERFSEQATWWQAQLEARGATDATAAMMAEQLALQQEQLERLQLTVAELKQGEEA